MQHTEQVTIDGKTYVLTHIAPTRSFKMLTRLLKHVGAPLGIGLEDLKPSEIEAVEDLDIKLGKAIGQLSQNIDEPEVHALVFELIAEITHDGKQLKGAYFDDHFLGRLASMSKLLLAQVKFQYRDFYDAVGGVVGGLAQLNSTPLLRRKSTGASGASSSPKLRLSRKLNDSGI